jgi:hypothetical protein
MVQVLSRISKSPRRGRPPRRLDHTLRRNKYPDSVFNHDRSYSVEACLTCIRPGCFLGDPVGATCMSLHFFTNFLHYSPAIPEREEEGISFCLSILQGRHRYRH